MDATPSRENEIATAIVDAACRVYHVVGSGLLESVYAATLSHELERRGRRVEREKAIPLRYEGVKLDIGFRIDLLVDDLVVVELKSVESMAPVHFKQVLTYLRLSRRRLGLLINFGAPTFREAVRRVVNGLP